jgi:SAM-dependent methyltransferase
MSDISLPLLWHVVQQARALGVHDQCRFHHCSADKLAPIAGESVDVVTTRAVLAYVADKPAALREFRRILKPGGRISLAEPILRDEALAVAGLKMQLDARPASGRQAHPRVGRPSWGNVLIPVGWDFPQTDSVRHSPDCQRCWVHGRYLERFGQRQISRATYRRRTIRRLSAKKRRPT